MPQAYPGSPTHMSAPVLIAILVVLVIVAVLIVALVLIARRPSADQRRVEARAPRGGPQRRERGGSKAEQEAQEPARRAREAQAEADRVGAEARERREAAEA